MKLYRRAPQWLHDDKLFLEEYVAKVPGWLFDYTAARTMDLLRWQEEQKKEGSLLEIGVFAGRYFSILARSALRTGSRIVGVDTFQFVSEQELHEQHLRFILELHPDVVFLARPSTAVTAQTLLAVLELPARFISIDGSHEAADVHWDLRLAEELLAPDGIVAVDDFLNPLTMGVGEGVHRFFSVPRALAPFGYVVNKLFLCRPACTQTYSKVLAQAVADDADHPRSIQFVADQAADPNRTRARLWGHEFLNVH